MAQRTPQEKKPRKAVRKKRTSVPKVIDEGVASQSEEMMSESSSSKSSSLPFKKRYVVIVLVLVLLGIAAYTLKGFIVAALVNGQPITRLQVIQELEKRGGSQTLSSLITETLILQEAKKENVSVSDSEVNQELATIENNIKSQGGTLDDILKQQGMSRSDLLQQVKIQKLVEKMLGKTIKVSSQEVDSYLKDNPTFDQGKSDAQKRKDAQEQVLQSKVGQAFQPWIDKLQKQANIQYFVSYQ